MARYNAQLRQYKNDIDAIIQSNGALLEAYCEENAQLMETGGARNIFEEALFKAIDRNDPATADIARGIAARFQYTQESLHNLASKRLANQLRGCRQAGAYLYEAAIPALMKTLHYLEPQLQYSALLALADFKKPDIIIQAFKIIQNGILVNERTVRAIVGKMGENKTQLYGEVLQLQSPALLSLFLKFIDGQSAARYVDDIRALAASEDMEVRIAAVRAMAASADEGVLPQLYAAINDSQWQVRAAAAKGLGNFPNSQSQLLLLRAMGDVAWWVRQNAAATVLSQPKPTWLVEQILASGDSYAIDALCYAADTMGMGQVVRDAGKLLPKRYFVRDNATAPTAPIVSKKPV